MVIVFKIVYCLVSGSLEFAVVNPFTTGDVVCDDTEMDLK